MPSGRSIAAFAVKFLFIYGTLAASWPLCGRAYAFFLRESGMVLFEAVGPHDHVRILADTAPDGTTDTALFVRDAAAGQGMRAETSSWQIGFQPTSVLVALVLATPVSMRRRVWALLAGLVMVHAFVLTRLGTIVILTPLVLPHTFWMQAFRFSATNFVLSYPLSCFAPVLIWIAVTMRREDARPCLRVGPSLRSQ
jgi:hypothetical protein